MLRGVGYLSRRMQFNKPQHWIGNAFHTRPCLLEANISDKSLKFKKFKIKQAKMQKDDGKPVYLKKGLPDKILYNVTLGLFIFTMIKAYNVLWGLDHLDD